MLKVLGLVFSNAKYKEIKTKNHSAIQIYKIKMFPKGQYSLMKYSGDSIKVGVKIIINTC
jgi:hypothetical protein